MGCGSSSSAAAPGDDAFVPGPGLGIVEPAAAAPAAAAEEHVEYQQPQEATSTEADDAPCRNHRRPAGAPDAAEQQPAEASPGDAFTLELGTGAGGRKSTIVTGASGGGLGAAEGASSALREVEFGALHEALMGGGEVTLQRLSSTVGRLLPQNAPAPEVLAALFKAWDVDDSGTIDEAELLAGCQALCGGDEAAKLRLTFACFDGDGDGHLTPDEVRLLLRGSVERAISGLHAAIDFASAFDDEPDIDDIVAEADGAASLEAVDGQVRVQLNTAAGPATLLVPSTALAGDAAALSVEDFVGALVEAAFAEHDKDGNGTIEQEEFVAFAQQNVRGTLP